MRSIISNIHQNLLYIARNTVWRTNQNTVWILHSNFVVHFFFQAEDGIRDAQESRGLGDVYKRQIIISFIFLMILLFFIIYQKKKKRTTFRPLWSCLILSTFLLKRSRVFSFVIFWLFSVFKQRAFYFKPIHTKET